MQDYFTLNGYIYRRPKERGWREIKRGSLLILFVCLVLVLTAMPVSTYIDTDALEKETLVIHPRFTNISFFYNDFYITDHGKAVLKSYIDART